MVCSKPAPFWRPRPWSASRRQTCSRKVPPRRRPRSSTSRPTRTWPRPSRKARSSSTAMRTRPGPPPSWKASARIFRRSRPATFARRRARFTTKSYPSVRQAASTSTCCNSPTWPPRTTSRSAAATRSMSVPRWRPTSRNTGAKRLAPDFWTGVTFAGISYSKAKVKPEEAPKTYKDLLHPRWKNAMSCKISSSGIQYVQWYVFQQTVRKRILEGVREAAAARLQLRACSCSTGSRKATTRSPRLRSIQATRSTSSAAPRSSSSAPKTALWRRRSSSAP